MKTIANIIHHKKFQLCIRDSNNNIIYFEYAMGFWKKSEYDSNSKRIYYETATGHIEDNRP